jgi:importin subunit beta-1
VWLIFLQLTVVGMKHADERVALQAVEFWTTVCEEEVELAAEANEVCAFCQVHRITSHGLPD